MGRPPLGGGPVFRFTPLEVAEMEACLQEINNPIPSREVISSLANKFSESTDRIGRVVVQPKQVLNWFQNRRYAHRLKSAKAPALVPRNDSLSFRNVAPPPPNPTPTPITPVSAGRNSADNAKMEYEAKSARDGAWYDVSAFISHRMFDTGDPEVRVRFAGFGPEEDEWVNVLKCVRQRSLPCEAAECVAVAPGDLILCFQEGKEQALYFDAHVLDAQRRRHDARGCRCRFLVRYDHDESEEIVPLRKICRRPETDYRLQVLHASKGSGLATPKSGSRDPSAGGSSNDGNSSAQKPHKQRKVMDVNTDMVTSMAVPHPEDAAMLESTIPISKADKGDDKAVSDGLVDDNGAPPLASSNPQEAHG